MQYNLGARKDAAQEGLGLLYTPYTGDKGFVFNLTDTLSNDAFKEPLWICKVRNLYVHVQEVALIWLTKWYTCFASQNEQLMYQCY